MDLAHTSRYWTSYRASKTFRLTIYVYEAHLGFSTAASHSEASGTKVRARISLPNDPTCAVHQTRHGRTPNPVWDQAVVLNDIDYSELVRVEIIGTRKLGESPLLARLEFEVHDVMGLSLREDSSVFQLECDRSRARFGVILLAFHFDPPVAADVIGGFDGGHRSGVPRGLAPKVFNRRREHEDTVTPAWGGQEPSQLMAEVDEPVYINVGGHFACLLLDDDMPVHNVRPLENEVSTASTVPFLVPSCPQAGRDDFGSAQSCSGRPRRTAGASGPLSSQTSSSEHSISDLSESTKHTKGITTRTATAPGRSTRDPRPRTGSFGGLAHQLSALGLGSGNAGVRPTSDQSWHRRALSTTEEPNQLAGDRSRQPGDPPHRWSMPRLRHKHDSAGLSSGAAPSNGDGPRRGAKSARPRGWTEGFLRSPTLGGLRARAWAATGSRKARARTVTRETSLDSADSSSASYSREGDIAAATPAVSAALQAALAAAEEEERAIESYDSRYDNSSYCIIGSEAAGASFWQP